MLSIFLLKLPRKLLANCEFVDMRSPAGVRTKEALAPTFIISFTLYMLIFFSMKYVTFFNISIICFWKDSRKHINSSKVGKG
jgi:hypothetical protein